MRQLMTVSVDAALKKRVEGFAKKHNMNRSELVKNALQRYMNIQEFEELRERFVRLGEKAGYFTDEDIYKDKDFLSRDSKDNAILQAAEQGNVQLLITGDKDLLDIRGKLPFQILSPRDFIELHTPG